MGEVRDRRAKGRGGLYEKHTKWFSTAKQEWVELSYWQATYDIPVDELPSGVRRKRITGSGKSENEAVARMRKNLAKYLRNPEVQYRAKRKADPNRQTVEEFLNEWNRVRQNSRISDVMLRKYSRTCDLHLNPHIGRILLDELNDEDLNKLFTRTLPAKRVVVRGKETEKQLLSEAACLNIYKTLNTALNWGVNKGKIPRNPMKAVSAPKPETPDENIPQLRHKAQRMLQKLHETNHPHFARFLFAFLGLRRAERLGLSWSNVKDLNGKKPRIVITQQLARREGGGWYIKPATKTGKNRTIPLFPPFLGVLREWKKEQDLNKRTPEWNPQPEFSDLVFLHDDGRVITLNQDNDDWNQLFVDLGWPPKDRFRGHACRHITATLLADMDDPPIPERVVMQILGHDSVAMTHYYARVTQDQMNVPLKTYGLKGFGFLLDKEIKE